MNSVDKLTVYIGVTAVIMGFTIWKTIKTKGIPNERKRVIYVLAAVVPMLGLALYFVFKSQNPNRKTAVV